MSIEINCIAPKNKNKWYPVWNHCYKIWETSPYKVKLWDDDEIDNLIESDDKEFFNILNKLPKIYKLDYVRFIILEKYGGAYFDLDVEIIDGSFFQKLKPQKLYIGGGYASSGVENNIIIETENFNKSFWFHLKLYCKQLINDESQHKNILSNVIYKVGPVALSNFYFNWIKDNRYNHTKDKAIQVLPWELFGNSYNDLSYCIHHHSNSWHSK